MFVEMLPEHSRATVQSSRQVHRRSGRCHRDSRLSRRHRMRDPPGSAAASTGGSPTQRHHEEDYDQINLDTERFRPLLPGMRITRFQTEVKQSASRLARNYMTLKIQTHSRIHFKGVTEHGVCDKFILLIPSLRGTRVKPDSKKSCQHERTWRTSHFYAWCLSWGSYLDDIQSTNMSVLFPLTEKERTNQI